MYPNKKNKNYKTQKKEQQKTPTKYSILYSKLVPLTHDVNKLQILEMFFISLFHEPLTHRPTNHQPNDHRPTNHQPLTHWPTNPPTTDPSTTYPSTQWPKIHWPTGKILFQGLDLFCRIQTQLRNAELYFGLFEHLPL